MPYPLQALPARENSESVKKHWPHGSLDAPVPVWRGEREITWQEHAAQCIMLTQRPAGSVCCCACLCVCVCAIEQGPDSLTPAAVPRRGNGQRRAWRWRITLIKDTANTLHRSGEGVGDTSAYHLVGFNTRLHFLAFLHKKVRNKTLLSGVWNAKRRRRAAL